MFNYLKIAQNIIDIVVNDLNFSHSRRHICTPLDPFSSDVEDVQEWFLCKQEKIFNEIGFSQDNIETLFWSAYLSNNQKSTDAYRNGNLSILPLTIVMKTTHIESVLNFTNNLSLLNDYYESHFIQHNLLTWANRLLHIFYTGLPIDDLKVANELKEKFELTDDDIKLIAYLKK